MKNPIISDIHSYSVFANIDDRKGNIEGYMIYLTKEQIEQIEDIILDDKIFVKEYSTYKVEDE